MKNQRIKSALRYCALLLLLALTVAAFVGAPALASKAELMQQSKDISDGYLADIPSRLYTNQAAYEAFEKQPELDNDALFSIRAPEGFVLKSYSKHWDEAKLQMLYEELKKNKHGKEIDYLHEIVVRAERDDYAAATHQGQNRRLPFSLDYPAFDGRINVNFTEQMGIITLYNGDKNTTIESMAHSLSHEYGHHYTFFHMFDDSTVGSSEYASIRNIQSEQVRTSRYDLQDYQDNHHWYLIEIAAEDYVQLMGSPTLFTHAAQYRDVRQFLGGQNSPGYSSMNGYPQENLLIPLACEVDGLADYFHSFIEQTPPDLRTEKRPIELKIRRGSSSHALVSGNRTFVHYELTWNMPYGDIPGVVYTLVCYDQNDYGLYAIKTVLQNQRPSAYIGTVSSQSATHVRWAYDNLDSGTKTFYVVVMFPDGRVELSSPLTHVF